MQSTILYRLNAAGQVAEETMEMDEGKTAYRETTDRDATGRVLRTVYYSSEGKPGISHVFVYRKRL